MEGPGFSHHFPHCCLVVLCSGSFEWQLWCPGWDVVFIDSLVVVWPTGIHLVWTVADLRLFGRQTYLKLKYGLFVADLPHRVQNNCGRRNPDTGWELTEAYAMMPSRLEQEQEQNKMWASVSNPFWATLKLFILRLIPVDQEQAPHFRTSFSWCSRWDNEELQLSRNLHSS